MTSTIEASTAERAFRTEVDRRRTFCIISHPDAGKTTLTEQLLLRGGAIRLAGDVRARKTARFAASDWMAIEQQRGISVTSSVMKYGYRGLELNLLDTPGHEDFSEDTFRVLTAVDSALMVIDSVKGVESRTRQLMEVCRMRDTPILTFINKLDREGRDPLELLSEIEETLGIHAVPLTWPIGRGTHLRGTYHLERGELALFNPRRTVKLTGLDDPALDEHVGARNAAALREDVELLLGAGGRYDREEYLAGRQTPVVFGSAVNGFGVDHLLDDFVEMAPPPRPRETTTREVSPYEPAFSGVVFKVQANMDPAHRDRIAFLRVCSGRYERGIRVKHGRTGKEVRIPNAMMFMAQEREGVEEAYPGDIIGIPNHGTIRVGDTFSEGEPLRFTGIPNFAPEHFRRIRLDNALRVKHLEKGLVHLSEEGAIQVFRPTLGSDYVLGAIGPLQFDVVVARLEREYNVEAHLSALPYEAARWVSGTPADLDAFARKVGQGLYRDLDGDLVFLAESQWRLQYTQENWPKITFHATKERA